MPVFKNFQAIARNAPYLWVNSRLRAIAFLLAAGFVLGLLFIADSRPAWMLLAYAEPKASADNWESVSARLAQAVATHSHIVLLAGGSTARELTGSDGIMSRNLTRVCSRPILFINAGTAAQSIIETWALTEAVPPDQLDLAVIATNYRSFEVKPENFTTPNLQRLPLPYPRDLAGFNVNRMPSLHQLGWIVQHLQAFTWNSTVKSTAQIMNAAPVKSDFCGPLSDCDTAPQPFTQKQVIAHRYIAERFAYFATFNRLTTEMWGNFTHQQRARNVSVLFLAAPESKALAPTHHLFEDAMERDLGELHRAGATTVDWRSGHGLPENQLYDQQHLTTAGRRSLFPQLVDLIARAMPECRMEPSP